MTTVSAEDLGYKQLPNYSTHAREFMLETAQRLRSDLGIAVDLEEFYAQYLGDAVVFLLPDNGFLFDGESDFKPSMYELQRLPYPMCALEFTAGDELFNAASGLAQAKKRIALCFDPHQLSTAQKTRLTRLHGREFIDMLPERCMCVMTMYEIESLWTGCVGLVVVNLEDSKPVKLSESDDQLRVLTRRVEHNFSGAQTEHGLPVDFYVFQERSSLVGQNEVQAIESLYIDTLDEMRVTYEFLAAINCSNVSTIDIAAPKMLNMKRAKKNKPLFRPYKILDIATQGSAKSASGVAGVNSSMRTHLRRGHLRRLGERAGNKTIWVNATMVNPSKSNDVVTTYKVK